jgi:hypothetical protein
VILKLGLPNVEEVAPSLPPLKLAGMRQRNNGAEYNAELKVPEASSGGSLGNTGQSQCHRERAGKWRIRQ